MSQNRRFCRLGLFVASGLIALIGFTPTGAVAGSSVDTGTAHSAVAKGDGWCC